MYKRQTKSKYVDESHRDDGSTSLIPGPRLRLLLDGLGSEVTPEQEAAARAAMAPVEAGRRHRKEISDTYGLPGALASPVTGTPAKASPAPQTPKRSPGSPQRSPSRSPGSPIRSPGGSRRFPNPYEGRFAEPSGSSPIKTMTGSKPHASWAPAYRSRSIMGLVLSLIHI